MRESLNDRSLSIALVVAQNGQGGSEGQVKLLARALAKAGHAVDVALIEGSGGAAGFERVEVRAFTSSRRTGLMGIVDALLSAVRLRRFLRRGDYDVVHAVMARAYVLAPLVSLTLKRRPLVVAWRRNEGVHLRNSVNLIFERMAARATDVIIYNTESARRYWLSQGVAGRMRNVVVRNALEDWRFDQASGSIPMSRSGRVLSIGGLKPVKQHQTLLDAVAQLPPITRPEVVILGDGDCRGDLASHAQLLDVRLVMPGHVVDTREWIAASDVYVQASRSEGLSNALLEAMAQGATVVATDVGGTREALAGAGVLVAPGDIAGMSVEIGRLLADQPRRRLLGAKARRRAAKDFTVAALVEAHLDLYGASY